MFPEISHMLKLLYPQTKVGDILVSRPSLPWLIWLKFYLETHYYILLIYTKNQDFMLRLKSVTLILRSP